MLRQKSTVTPVSYLAVLILFLFSANSSIAQTPQAPSETPIEKIATPARVTADSTTVAPATAVTPDETTAAKTSVETPNVAEPAKTETNVTPVAGPPPMQAQCKRNVEGRRCCPCATDLPEPSRCRDPGRNGFRAQDATRWADLAVQLRADKRPRPIVLRANVGDCIQITLTNNIPPANFAITHRSDASRYLSTRQKFHFTFRAWNGSPVQRTTVRSWGKMTRAWPLRCSIADTDTTCRHYVAAANTNLHALRKSRRHLSALQHGRHELHRQPYHERIVWCTERAAGGS